VKTIAAGKFKAQCLALLDEVAREHETILVTKRGKPVARVVPVSEEMTDLRGRLKGSVLREKDIISPVPFTWKSA
jgi:prevent-host-death family protein